MARASWSERLDGRACWTCGARSGLVSDGGRYVRCRDRAACEARHAKHTERSRARAQVLVLEEPAAPEAPLGTCRWCGAELTGRNASRRNYCYPDREGRDCAAAWNASRVWDARDALRWLGRHRGDGVLRCAACGVEVARFRGDSWGELVSWDADHELALEDGGEHALENLRVKCAPCHRAKTAEESRRRAAARRPPPAEALWVDG